MFEVTIQYFDMDGNEISSDEWADSLITGVVKASFEQYIQRATENVSQMVCPVHGGKAELTFNVTGIPDNPSIEIQATSCCDDFAQKALEEAHRSWSTT